MPSLPKRSSKRRKKVALRPIQQSQEREARSFQPLPERSQVGEPATPNFDQSDALEQLESSSSFPADGVNELRQSEGHENLVESDEEYLSLDPLTISQTSEERQSRHQSHYTRKQNEEKNYQQYRRKALDTFTQASCQEQVSDRYKAMAEFFKDSTTKLVQVGQHSQYILFKDQG